jgi:hypothetical protein
MSIVLGLLDTPSYIALGIVECAVNLSGHAQILNTACPVLLNVTEKFVDRSCTLLTAQRQFIIVISFELWGWGGGGQHSASPFSFIFIMTRQNSCDVVDGEQLMSLGKQFAFATNEIKTYPNFFLFLLLHISMETLLFRINVVFQLPPCAYVTAK